jgi:hypothetical protein
VFGAGRHPNQEKTLFLLKEAIYMKIPSLKQQYFGDLNRQLNSRRRQMNAEIREEILERINKDKNIDEQQ